MKKVNAFLAVSAVVFFCIWAIWPSVMLNRDIVKAPDGAAQDIATSLTKAGQLGDAFGALTSLVSAVTLALIIYGVLLQRQQLVDAQQEARAEREARHDEAAERHFFQMLTLLERHAETFEIKPFRGMTALRSNAKEVVKFAAKSLRVTNRSPLVAKLRRISSVVTFGTTSLCISHSLTPFSS